MKRNEKLRKDTKNAMYKKGGFRQVELASIIGCTDNIMSKFLNGWIKLPEKHHKNLKEWINK